MNSRSMDRKPRFPSHAIFYELRTFINQVQAASPPLNFPSVARRRHPALHRFSRTQRRRYVLLRLLSATAYICDFFHRLFGHALISWRVRHLLLGRVYYRSRALAEPTHHERALPIAAAGDSTSHLPLHDAVERFWCFLLDTGLVQKHFDLFSI